MLLVDGHVHLYDCYGIGAAFDAATAHFAAAARALGCTRDHEPVLCLVAGACETFWSGVRTGRQGRVWRGKHGFWEAELGAEPEALSVRCGHSRLTVIAGRQIVTRERLEVLALGTVVQFRAGEPIERTLGAVRDAGAVTVLPWGIGKWLGPRGAIIEAILADPQWSHVLLGDNGNRLTLGPEPAQFAIARRQQRPILPGTDPLPLPGEEARVGSYGFALDAALDPERPAAALLEALRSDPEIVPFGSRTPMARFVSRQIKLSLKNRVAAGAA